MARRVILDTQYTFNPSTRTVVIPRKIPRERILLITNVTNNTVIYNFSDSTLGLTAYSTGDGQSNFAYATTTVVLAFNTTSMSSTDKLQIVVDEPAELFIPDEALLDPVGKFRTSTPQALIDTDFEYGLQPTKWETIVLNNYRPSFFVNTQSPLSITGMSAINGNSSITVFTSSTIAAGQPILVQDSQYTYGNGPFLIDQVGTGSFTYTARSPFTGVTGSVYNSALTAVFLGNFYTGALLNFNGATTVGNTIYVTTTQPHGLVLGNGIYVSNSTVGANGSWFVASVTNSTAFAYVVNAVPTGTPTNLAVYSRPDGSYFHRAFDGGVQFTTGTPSHGNQTIRQTRRYFRYQSGKGIQISTGTLLKPNLYVDEISLQPNGQANVVTVTTKQPHQLTPGTQITVSGCNETGFNGNNYVVQAVLNPNQFIYQTPTNPSANVASGIPNVSVVNWYGAGTRLGMFDTQNGFYFEYDGQQLYAVRRRSTDQIAGYVNVTNNSTTVTGAFFNTVTTKFSKQLTPGDFIVIRGMSHRVISIQSDTQMNIHPPYRGATLSGQNVAVVSKTVEQRVPQSQFNMDRLDGTGPSGLVLDLSKMQMFYLDYSWYGAGVIRLGFRDTRGNVFYCHRFVNNNQNNEAYMRSGNLPARYESHTLPAVTVLTSNVLIGDTTLTVANTSLFPTSGSILIENPNSFEYIYYTGTTPTSFTGLTRGKSNTQLLVNMTANSANLTTTDTRVTSLQPGMFIHGLGVPAGTYVYQIGSGATTNIVMTTAATLTQSAAGLNFQNMGSTANAHSITNTAPIAVSLHSPSFAPTISHWGTSVIMDGRFDDDKSLIFTYGEPIVTSVAQGATVPLVSIRVSPSVDSGITGTLGLKEIINRMQLKLVQVDTLTQGNFLMNIVLNGTVSNTNQNSAWQNTFSSVAVGTSSLSQIADHVANNTIYGGETIYGWYAVNSAGATNYSVVSTDLTQVRDLGNSILGGAISNSANTNFYPDGPDIVTLTARNIGVGTANVQVRLSWTEAQA
jgi:hypothetical protein